jgi:hypothetical protein
MKFKIEIAACLLTTAVLMCFQPPLAQETRDHWLIGRWVGNISGYIGRSSASRTLRVTGVAPDGLAQGTWYVTGQQPLSALILVEEARVRILTAGKSTIELTLQEDDLLVGKYISDSGESLPIKLARIESPSEK